MAPRQTPLERIAHLLPSNLTSIPWRKRLSLDSPPTALLQQLDHLWKPLTTPFPEFPTNYPPEFPALDDPDLVCKAVDPKVNVMLEWLGDTVVKVAANESLRQAQNSCLPLNQGVVNWLVSKAFLARLGLLYGLHWHEPTDGVQEMPSQGRMCDLFEALVGAVSQSLGIPLAVEWLVQLFRPWATPHGIHTPCTRTPWDLADQAIPEAFSRQGIDWLGISLPGYSNLDISGVSLPADYPPSILMPSDALKTMMDTVFRDGLIDGVYASFGESVRRLVLSSIICQTYPTRTVMECESIRDGCARKQLFGRLALVCGVHRYMRLNVVKEPTSWWYISPAQGQRALTALLGYVFIHEGFDVLMSWAQPFFLPWIDALAQEKFTPASNLKPRCTTSRAPKTATRTRYSTTIPLASRRVHISASISL